MDSSAVVHSGWLKKSPPERKLRLCAWRKRWFILRSSQQGGDPGVLEYYKHDNSKKPLRKIILGPCEQVHANVTFHLKGSPRGFLFIINTKERTFYLVAETKEDVHKWVQSICQVCGFHQEVENTGSLRNVFSASQDPWSFGDELSCSCQQHLQERWSTLSYQSQSSVLSLKSSVGEDSHPTWSSRAPQLYLHINPHLDHCISRGAENARSDNFSQNSQTLFLMRRDMATQEVSHGDVPCVHQTCGQAQGLSIPSSPHWHSPGFRHLSCNFPQHTALKNHTTSSETDCENPYSFKAPKKSTLSTFQIPETSVMDKSHSTVTVATPGNRAMTTPCHPHKSSHVETPQQNCPSQDHVLRRKDKSVSFAITVPSCRDFPAVDSSHLHQDSFPEACKYSLQDTESTGLSSESRILRASFHQEAGTDAGHLNEAGSEDDYVPMSSIPSILLAMGGASGNSQNIHNSRSPGSPHFGPLSCPPTALSHKGLVRGSEIQLPTGDLSLKPGQKAKPVALDLCGRVLGKPSSQSPRTMSSVTSEEDNYVVVD